MKNKYIEIWDKILKRIIDDGISPDAPYKLQLEGQLFRKVGKRKDYSVNRFSYKNGKCESKQNSSVARGLIYVLKNSSDFLNVFKERTLYIRMDKLFKFTIDIQSTKLVKSFPPIADEQSEILILGTAPGKCSLQTGEYYANSNNIFWNIISNLFNENKPFLSYKDKIECLKSNHIALWDTLRSCQRKGSCDDSIEEEGEKPNDINAFLRQHPNITKIVFNGETAFKKALKYHKLSIPCFIASSTSSRKRLSYEGKKNSWEKALKK